MFDFTKMLLRTEIEKLDYLMLHTRTNEAYREYDARRTELLDVISMLALTEREAKEKAERKAHLVELSNMRNAPREDLVEVGQRYEIIRPIDGGMVFHDIPAGTTGTLTINDEEHIGLELDEPHVGLEEWNNVVYWYKEGGEEEKFNLDTKRI